MTLHRSWLVQATDDELPSSTAANARDARLAQAGLYAKDSSGLVRAGLLGAPVGVVQSRVDMALDIGVLDAVLTRGISYGAVPVANDGIVTVALPASPSSNSRWVRVGLIHRDNVDAADPASAPEFVVVQGAAAASPSLPSLPVGALPIARVLQPANVLGTDGCTVTEDFPMTAAAGGVVAVRNSTERNAWQPDDGALCIQLDTDQLYRREGGNWEQAAPYAMAAGRGSNAAGAYATVNFPAGRFTQPPIVTAITSGANVALMNTGTVTKDSAQIAGFTTAGLAMACSWQWIAIQMTPTAAAG